MFNCYVQIGRGTNASRDLEGGDASGTNNQWKNKVINVSPYQQSRNELDNVCNTLTLIRYHYQTVSMKLH